MNPLVTNDDGVYAPGISILTAALAREGLNPTVVAPDRERSSVGHAITLTRPLRVWPVTGRVYPADVPAYCCDGTPSDCVVLGVDEVAPETDWVISGINNGPNLGDDLTYSGTVSAAMEGTILGRHALAVSLNCHREHEDRRYEDAAEIVIRLLRWVSRSPIPYGVLLNVNIPNLPLAEMKGIKVTRQGKREYADKVTPLTDPFGRAFYWVAGRPEDDLVEGSDVWAVAHGFVSVTPVHMDMTHYDTMALLRDGGVEGEMF
ncbi:MAG: 5'/3'-nucleotidase SurE [Dethiosulfovibrio peptidovorans]|nr:MAG: 5'/3'-nucleotidase SurE [Dethiosulfovibrio peptidovorans]